jgi:Zn finger protein HypA/HybF involved in hydrogenase expression
MHELSIAMSLVDAICEELPKLGDGARVGRVRVRVGSRSGVVDHALAFAFAIAIEESAIAGASLEIEQTGGRELELIHLEVFDGPADRGSAEEHPEEERRAGGRAS